jgi:hypothetical protein
VCTVCVTSLSALVESWFSRPAARGTLAHLELSRRPFPTEPAPTRCGAVHGLIASSLPHVCPEPVLANQRLSIWKLNNSWVLQERCECVGPPAGRCHYQQNSSNATAHFHVAPSLAIGACRSSCKPLLQAHLFPTLSFSDLPRQARGKILNRLNGLAFNTTGGSSFPWCEKRLFLAPCIHHNDHFTKTGSGQTWEKLRKRVVAFFAGRR